MAANSFADTVVNGMLSWLKGFANWVLRLFDLAGSGGVSPLEWLSDHWLQLFSGVPTAAAVVCLCLFGASALHVSGRLQRAAFGRQEASALTGARGLLAQYLMLDVLFLPICGVSTALACLAGQLGQI